MNLSTAEIEAEIVVLASEYSVLSKLKLWRSSLILMAAEGWGEKEICTKGAVGGGVKITPAQSHHYFAKLRSPTNGVSDWWRMQSAANIKSYLRQQRTFW